MLEASNFESVLGRFSNRRSFWLAIITQDFWLADKLFKCKRHLVSIILKTFRSQILDLAIDEQNSVNFTFLKK